MASLEKAGVFLQRLFRHHITVPDGREVLALTWLPSLGNALDQTALLGCFCLRKVAHSIILTLALRNRHEINAALERKERGKSLITPHL